MLWTERHELTECIQSKTFGPNAERIQRLFFSPSSKTLDRPRFFISATNLCAECIQEDSK